MNKIKVIVIAIFTVLCLYACKAPQAGTVSFVPFKVASGYFVKNTYNKSNDGFTITTQQEFDKIFGVAKTMNNTITQIDFSQQFVFAVTEEATNSETKIMVQNVKKYSPANKKHEVLIVAYEVSYGKNRSFSTKPFIVLVLDKKYYYKCIIDRVENL